jgi:hypothetical protein
MSRSSNFLSQIFVIILAGLGCLYMSFEAKEPVATKLFLIGAVLIVVAVVTVYWKYAISSPQSESAPTVQEQRLNLMPRIRDQRPVQIVEIETSDSQLTSSFANLGTDFSCPVRPQQSVLPDSDA